MELAKNRSDNLKLGAIRAPAYVMLMAVAWVLSSQFSKIELTPYDSDGTRVGELHDGVNPNLAPWWELTILPRIGEVTARSIVEYRESTEHSGATPVFAHPEDLEAVHRIGPKTVERIRPWLRFDR